MVLQSKPKVKIISLPELGSVFGGEEKRSAALYKKYVLHQKARSHCGGASCVVDGTKSVQVVIIRKSITTAPTLQQLLII